MDMLQFHSIKIAFKILQKVDTFVTLPELLLVTIVSRILLKFLLTHAANKPVKKSWL